MQLKLEKYGENVVRLVLAENLSHNYGNNLEFNYFFQSVITNILYTVALFQEIFNPALKSKKQKGKSAGFTSHNVIRIRRSSVFSGDIDAF